MRLKVGGIATLSIVLAIACVVILSVQLSLRQQRHALEQRTQLDANLLSDILRPSDLLGMTSARRTSLADTIRHRVLGDGASNLAVYSADGRLVLTTERGHGTSLARAHTQTPPFVDGASSSIQAEVAPLRLSGDSPAGAVVAWVPRGAMTAAAWRAAVPFLLIVPLILLILIAPLAPVLRRLGREIRESLDESESQALHDGLTGLPNRRLFEDRVQLALKRAHRNGTATALVLLDLDRFKEINDTLGHAAGDRFLREVGSRLSVAIRGADTVARIGGDEFALILNDVDRASASDTAERVTRALRAPSVIGGLSMTVGASIGIAVYPEHGDTAGTLLQHADIAMYSAKRAGTPFEFYDANSDRNDPERLSLAQDLQVASGSGQFVLYYQPKLDLRTNDVVGVEGLLRWNHPTRGMLDAAQFMPLAEEIGVATAISERAVGDAIAQCGEWQRQGIDLAVAVNLGARNLIDPDLPRRLIDLLDEHDVEPEQIELEITETSIIDNPLLVRRVAIELERTGIDLAIGNFGTGYSSLSYLSQLPISKLKIDRSLVGGIVESESKRIIVGATIDLAHSLGLEVVAEGVEDEETLQLLRDLGSDFAQGFHVGVPAPAESFVDATSNSAVA